MRQTQGHDMAVGPVLGGVIDPHGTNRAHLIYDGTSHSGVPTPPPQRAAQELLRCWGDAHSKDKARTTHQVCSTSPALMGHPRLPANQ